MDILLLGRTLHLIDRVIKELSITFCSPVCRTKFPSHVVKAVEPPAEPEVKFHKGLVEVMLYHVIYLVISLSLPSTVFISNIFVL